MNNTQGDANGPDKATDPGYDWSIGEPPVNTDAAGVGTAEFEKPPRRSKTVLVLIGLICLLIVIIVVGALVIYLQRDKDDVLDEASVEPTSMMTSSNTSAASSSSEKARESSENSQSKTGGATNDNPCMRLNESENSLLAFSDEEAERLSDGYKNPVTLVVYCDGTWAQIGRWGSEPGYPRHWNGREWESVNYDESRSFGMWPGCWSREKLKSQGASEAALETFMLPYCEDEKQTNSGNSASAAGDNQASSHSVTGIRNPACDGRYILIADSAVVQSGQDPQAVVNAHLANYSGAYVAEPGACPSLRAVEPNTGGDIYAIYYDYGFDATAACAAYGTKGDHDDVRILTNTPGDYRSPC